MDDYKFDIVYEVERPELDLIGRVAEMQGYFCAYAIKSREKLIFDVTEISTKQEAVDILDTWMFATESES